MDRLQRILFVCLGNIVRSPLAENLFRHLAAQRGLDGEFEVDSAGTSSYHVGEQPDARMRRVAAEQGLEYTGRARQVGWRDLEEYDLILAMDHANLDTLRSLAQTDAQRERIRLMRDFDPLAEGVPDVPDPYYGGAAGFEQTYEIVERSVQGLLDWLENETG